MAPELTFDKYHGLGNDFVILHRQAGDRPLDSATVVRLCDRHRGIGADGILSIWPDAGSHGRMQVQNADGSESQMCGNGLRCVARYLHDAGVVPAVENTVRIRAGDHVHACVRTSVSTYRVGMGQPCWQHAELPPTAQQGRTVSLHVEDRSFQGTCVHLGNPHVVIFLDPTSGDDPLTLAQHYGPMLSNHAAFARRTNVSFVVPAADGFRGVVYERGAGITQACGSGACAIGVSAIARGLWPAQQPVNVTLLGGTLIIRVAAEPDADGDQITMEGAAERVFHGSV